MEDGLVLRSPMPENPDVVDVWYDRQKIAVVERQGSTPLGRDRWVVRPCCGVDLPGHWKSAEAAADAAVVATERQRA